MEREERERLILQYDKMVHMFVNKYIRHEKDDATQELYLALIKAIDTFDVSRGTKLTTYVYLCLLFATFRFIDNSRDKHIDYEQYVDDIESGECSFDERLYQDSFHSDIYGRLHKCLSPSEMGLLMHLVNGGSLKEYVAKTGKTYSCVTSTLSNIRKKWRRYIDEHE